MVRGFWRSASTVTIVANIIGDWEKRMFPKVVLLRSTEKGHLSFTQDEELLQRSMTVLLVSTEGI